MPQYPLLTLLIMLVLFNVLITFALPARSRVVMGTELFIAGIVTLIIAVMDLLNPLGISDGERLILFVAGCINCFTGYYMTLLETSAPT